MFLIDPKVFGRTCFVRDVRPQVSKLDLKSLKCIFVGYSRVKKECRCYCPTLRRYFVSTDVSFLKTTPFSLPSTVMSPRKGDDLLVYYVSLSIPTLALIPVTPPITQVYSRRQNPPTSSPTPSPLSSDPIQNNDLSIALHKGKR